MDNQEGSFNPLNSLRFFVTSPHPCGYFPDRNATTLVLDPETQPSLEVYTTLSRLGFRRSGSHVYRPHCGTCQDCIPLRIPVNRFKPNRSQHRAWKRNPGIKVSAQLPDYNPDHYQLYRRYIQSRHQDGGMDSDNPLHYQQFIQTDWCNTQLFEFREDSHLLAVAVTDILEDGLSAVYTFYEPEQMHRGLGIYGILWQVEEARRRQLDYVYLGYWIADSPKMRYKSNFKPYEYFDGQGWLTGPE